MFYTIPELITHACNKYKNKVAIRNRRGYRTEDITYTELYDKILKVSNLFHKLKIKKQDKILILGQSSLEYVILFLAAVFQGVIVVPLDLQSNVDLIKKIKTKIKPKAMFTSSNIRLNIPVIKFDEIESKYKSFSKRSPASINPSDTVEILLTSGTTGDPKGVVLTNYNFMSGVNSLRKVVKLPKLKFISVLPLSHVLEQVIGLLIPLSYGCSILYPETIRPSILTEIIRNKGINGIVCVPATLESLKQPNIMKNLGIRFFLMAVGGARLDPELERYWKRKLKLVLQGYGATESTALIAANTLFRRKIGYVGKPIPGLEIKLDNEEILVKGPNVFKEYYKDEEKTKEAFANGWYKTGDLGFFNGAYLCIKGRKKDMIVTESGENVYPEDIEEVLNKIKGIKESCVVEEEGKIKAYIIPSKKIELDQVIKNANSKLLPKQRISDYAFWDEASFPKTPIGKIKKIQVKQKGIKGKKKAIVYESKLFELIAGLSPKNPKSNSKLGKDLLFDSLKRVQLMSKIEEEFNVEIPEQNVDENTTVKQLERMIYEHKSTQRFRMNKWLLNHTVVFVRRFFQELLIFPLLRIFWKVNCKGTENILNLKEPVIFMPNHQSSFDVITILKCLPFKLRSRIAVAASPPVIFGIPPPKKRRILKKILSFNSRFFLNAYPFGNEIGLERSLRITGELLDRKFSVIVFPEGRRTTDGRINSFQLGTGFLALQMNVKIVPVRLEGLYELHPIGNFWPKSGTVSVTFGKPKQIKNSSYPKTTKIIEDMVRNLGKDRN
ncbi:MAG: AMP-binding protein [Nanoarchaeota archaeon]|nr:AMP-binding protein [Nanoarchaeota archaeon]